MSQDISIIQQLRDLTGAGVMDCKKALDEASGDVAKAAEIIKAKGIAKVEKRADRATGSGMIFSYDAPDGYSAILDARAETDFVIKSEPFQQFAAEAVKVAAEKNITNLEDLNAAILPNGKTVGESVNEVIAKVGENSRINAVAVQKAVKTYVHNGRIGVLLDAKANDINLPEVQSLISDLAMHIAAAAPSGMEDFMAQPFIKDESKTVKEVLASSAGVEIISFSRLQA
jgi:elongation factor Ts